MLFYGPQGDNLAARQQNRPVLCLKAVGALTASRAHWHTVGRCIVSRRAGREPILYQDEHGHAPVLAYPATRCG